MPFTPIKGRPKMKSMKVLLGSAIVFAMLFNAAAAMAAQSSLSVSETNLDKLSVYPGSGPHISNSDKNDQPYIVYGDSSKENIAANYVALFINGNIIKNSNLIIENDRTLLPLRLISETLGAKVEWNDKLRKVTISDENTSVELIIGDMNPKVNGKAVAIDAAPKIFNDYTYVPARFVAEALNSKVDYFDGRTALNGDGTGISDAYYLLRMPQVMISRYPKDAEAMAPTAAIEAARTQFITAYEKKFGAFARMEKNPAPDLSGPWSDEKEALSIRYQISNLAVTSENDRFYIMHMVWEFWVDKYTGTVYQFYNGNAMRINKFDPNSPGAFAFAG
jgi:hypothetical protein